MFIRGMYIPKAFYCFVEGDDTPAGGGKSQEVVTLQSRLDAANGSAMVVAQQLSNENFNLNTKVANHEATIAGLNTQIADLKKQIPAEGAKVLTKEEAATYEAILALGKPEEIKAKLEEYPTLKTKLADQERADTLRRAADSEGYDVKAFAGIAGMSELDYEFKQVEEGGKSKEAAFVKIKENGVDKTVPLAEYVTKYKAEFLPALKKVAVNNQHVRQTPSGDPPSTSVYDKIRERKKTEREEKSKDVKPIRERLNLARSA